ncbi:substrate-binding periplasmic protein [Ottowia thiooxydans]|uniref:substrate-binding periplasmic protein n=1 Tax=Ottowia thiooxydans TaxID=219182 RepID=UPI0004174A96|nr:transporter substrate-binding domain-containing protein [Ottowia thiooxydans]
MANSTSIFSSDSLLQRIRAVLLQPSAPIGRFVPSISSILRRSVFACLFGAMSAYASGGNDAKALTLRLAHDQNFPPFAESVDGRSRGMAIDLVSTAADRAGVPIQFVPVPFEQIQRTLNDGRADIIFPIAVNAERLKTMDFGRPLMMSGGAIFVRAPAIAPADTNWLNGKVIVTPKTGPLAGFIAKHMPEAKLIVTADYDESLKRLVDGEADAAALNKQVGAMLAAQQYPGKITPGDRLFLELPLAMATPKGKGDRLKLLDDAIEKMRADGTWQSIVDRWTPPR